MASEDMGLVPSRRIENGLNPQLVFQDDHLRFNCGAPQRRVGDPGPKTRERSGFIDEKMFSVDRDRYFQPQGAEFRRSMYGDGPDRRDCTEIQNWNGNGNGRTPTTPSGDGSDEDEDDEEDDDEIDEGDGEVEGLVGVDDGNKNNNNSSGSVHSNADKIGNGKPKHHSSFVGSSREIMMKDGNIAQSVNNTRASPSENHHQGRVGHYQNAVTIAEPDGEMYYSQFIHGSEGSGPGQKDIVVENGCGISAGKDASFSSESGEPLRTILSDPLTGALMDDAMILPCGHSFGGVGIQNVLKMKACYTCSQSISEDSVAPNLSLRAAVQAFRREEELQFYRASKRRKERFEEKVNYGDSTLIDPPRGRGVQFPFSVTDRVIIKGNKRTPQRFVGREAVVTTQCLNGWYVVKTLDNAESVKLQYRSLTKVSDNQSSKPMPSKMIPNWL